MKRRLLIIFLGVVMAAGLAIMLYPTVSDLVNKFHQTEVVISYAKAVEDTDAARLAQLRAEAQAYNAALAQNGQHWVLSDAERAGYERQLRLTDDGVMGSVEIPSIRVNLPIYYGTSDAVLQEAIGHLEGSSLPVGGPDTHVVISGHRGLPSAKLFTELDKLAVGDLFYLKVLGETLAYQVDQIQTIEPGELTALKIQPGQDLCTLVTCTPYGINTHRLLVRGHRVPVPETPPPTETTVALETILEIFTIIALLAVVVTIVLRQRRKRLGSKKN